MAKEIKTGKKPDKFRREHIIHNCHVHLFTIDYFPAWYLPLPTSLMRSKWVARQLLSLLRRVNHRLAAFAYAASKKDMKAVFETLAGYYPGKTRFCVLSIDFDYMRAGRPRKDFKQQIQDLADLAREINSRGDERLLPFIGADPRRPGIERLVREYIEERGFRGIKLYPSLGYFPDDERLWGVYKFAQEYQVPITTHCIPKNKNHYRARIPQPHRDKSKSLPGWDVRDQYHPYHFARWYNHPHWYGELLKRFPELKINFGHFGGNTEWDKYLDHSDSKPGTAEDRDWNSRIRKLLKDYPNTYADISYTVYDRALYPFLKVLLNTRSEDTTERALIVREGGEEKAVVETVKEQNIRDKLLFGTDFYMLQKDYSERRFSIDLRGYLSDEEYWLIAETNPRRFLAMSL